MRDRSQESRKNQNVQRAGSITHTLFYYDYLGLARSGAKTQNFSIAEKETET